MQQQHQAGDVDGRLEDRLDMRARQALAHQDHADKARSRDRRQRTEKKSPAIPPADRAIAPKEYRPSSTSGTRTRYRLRIPSTRQLSPIFGGRQLDSNFRFAALIVRKAPRRRGQAGDDAAGSPQFLSVSEAPRISCKACERTTEWE